MKSITQVLVLILLPCILWAQKSGLANDTLIIIHESTPLELVGDKVFYLEDSEGTWTIGDVLAFDKKGDFLKNETPIFVRNPTYKAYWLKLQIINHTQEDLYIEVHTENMGYLDYYVLEDNSAKHLAETGVMRPEENRPYPVNFYWLKLEKKEGIQTIYLRLQTQSAFDVPIQVGLLEQLIVDKSNNDSIYYGFIGLVLIMIGYNLFLYISIRDTIYAIYSFYLLMVLFVVPYANNYPFYANIFGNGFRSFAYQYYLVWSSPLNLCTWLFAIRILNLKSKFPTAYSISILFGIIQCILIPVSNLFYILPYYINIALFQLSALVGLLFLFGIGLYLWLFKGENQAKFYTIAWFWIIVSAFAVIFTINGILPYHFFTRNASFFGTGLEILFFSLALGDRFNKMRKENLRIVESQKEELEVQVLERTKEIQKQKQDIEDSILYAQRIQQAILPLSEEMQSYLKEYFILFKPRDIVSGDFYYFQPIHQKIMVAVVDCSGHGVPGAFMSMLAKEILDNIIVEHEILEADIILNELHKGIRKVLKQDQSDNKDGMDISLLVIDQESNCVEFASARQPLIYIKNGQLFEIKGDKISIGGTELDEKERIFTKHLIEMPENNTQITFYMFSDGFQDQFGGRKGRKFMRNRLKSILQEINGQDMDTQKTLLNQYFEDWIAQGNERQIDDVLIMGMRVN